MPVCVYVHTYIHRYSISNHISWVSTFQGAGLEGFHCVYDDLDFSMLTCNMVQMMKRTQPGLRCRQLP